MLGLIQRVRHASVSIDNNIVAQIGQGILVLTGMEKHDQPEQADKLVHRLLNYRIFADSKDKMNLSVADIGGGVLLVPQFTLAADTQKGLRPSFSSAMPPEAAEKLFQYFVQQAEYCYPQVVSGQFGADMQVSLVNNGPVTFLLKV